MVMSESKSASRWSNLSPSSSHSPRVRLEPESSNRGSGRTRVRFQVTRHAILHQPHNIPPQYFTYATTPHYKLNFFICACFPLSLCPPGLIYDTIGDYTVAFTLMAGVQSLTVVAVLWLHWRQKGHLSSSES